MSLFYKKKSKEFKERDLFGRRGKYLIPNALSAKLFLNYLQISLEIKNETRKPNCNLPKTEKLRFLDHNFVFWKTFFKKHEKLENQV